MKALSRVPRFVNCRDELSELRNLADRGEPALALLYGRRRVGKTFLLDHAFRDRRYFYYLAGDTTKQLNKLELLREVAPHLSQPADAAPELFPSWRHVFRLFVDLARQGPLVVVLDEFQHLLSGNGEDVPSQLMAVWDRELHDVPLTLILCGSEVSGMQSLGGGAGPLYGRWAWAARLRPFTYEFAAEMVPGRPLREQATIYGILGGTPRYLSVLRPDDELPRRLSETLLSPRGQIHVQLDRIVEQEQGIREPGDYRAVLSAIADGRTRINEIAAVTGMTERVHAVRRILEILEGLDLVGRERNFAAPAKAPYRYFIADQALRFWYRFVQPHRSRLETGSPLRIWAEHVEPQLDQYMGKAFERISREAYVRRHKDFRLAEAAEWARWEGRDRNGRSIEVDLVARLTDGSILTGEVKWSSRPIGSDVHRHLVRNLKDLANSGQGWARDALAEQRSAGHLYVSAAGFKPEFRRLAEEQARIRLVTLEDLYQ